MVYEEVRELAAQKMAQEKPGQTLQLTALVGLPASGGCRAAPALPWARALLRGRSRALKKALSHKDPAIRIPTACLMVTLDLQAALAEPVLVAGLKEPSEALKVQAADALSQRGLQADAVLPIVIAGSKNELASVR